MERLIRGQLYWDTTEPQTPQWRLNLEDSTGTVTQTLVTPSPSPPQDATHEQLARLIALTLFPEHRKNPDDVRLQASTAPPGYQFVAKYSEPVPTVTPQSRRPEGTTSIGCVTFDCADPSRLARFWAGVLDYEVRSEKDDWVVVQSRNGSGPRLGFQRVPEPKGVKNRVHLDIHSLAGTLETAIQRLEGLGARQVRLVTNHPPSMHMIMQDPEGNEFCLVAE